MKRTAVVVFSGLALMFCGIGNALMPGSVSAKAILLDVTLAPALAMGLFLLGAALPQLDAAGRLVSGLWPALAFSLLSGDDEGTTAYLAGFGAWPFIVAGLAAALSLVPRKVSELPTMALLPFGAVLALGLYSVLLSVAPDVARFLGATPYHFIITLTLGTTVVALVDVASASLSAPRERLIRSLTAMMPLLGFLGTIAGLIGALGALPAVFAEGGQEADALARVISGLATAFETTLLGLIGAASCNFILVLLADREAARR